MSKLLSFVKLDFLTIKPYLTFKSLFILILLFSYFIFISDNASAPIAMFGVFGALYACYPFAIGEKNGIDGLYTTLSIKRQTVVFGRYLFALFVDLCSALIGFSLAFICFTLFKRKDMNLSQSLLSILIILALVSIIQFFQLPIYFKLGYTKAKILSYLPYVLLAILLLVANTSPAVSSFLEPLTNWLSTNQTFAILTGILIWFLLLFTSYGISYSCYRKRDF